MLIQKEMDIKRLKYGHVHAVESIIGERLDFDKSSSLNWKNVFKFVQNNVCALKYGNYRWYGVMCCAVVADEKGRGADNTYDWLVKKGNKLAKMRPDLQPSFIFPHMPLIAAILHGYSGENPLSATVYENYLHSAPIEGASHVWKADTISSTPAPWHSLSLFCPWQLSASGYYNMIDYMLLYNAYQLVYCSNLPEFKVFAKAQNRS